MLLAIDSGNSKLKAMYFHEDESLNGKTFSVEKGKINLLLSETSHLEIKKVVYLDSGGFSNKIENAVFGYFQTIPFNVSHFKQWPFKIDYDSQEPGTDRLVAMLAAKNLSMSNNFFVVTLGTCMTFNAVLNGVFKYGSISLGIQSQINGLHQFTGTLPLINLTKENKIEFQNGGTNQNITNGVLMGSYYQILASIKEFNPELNMPVYICGGHSYLFKEAFPENFKIIPNLNFLGLKNIAETINEK